MDEKIFFIDLIDKNRFINPYIEVWKKLVFSRLFIDKNFSIVKILILFFIN